AVDLATGPLEHVGREVDARHVAVARIRRQREPRSDPDLEHLRTALDAELSDDPLDPRVEDTLEDLVVVAGELRIDLALVWKCYRGRHADVLEALRPRVAPDARPRGSRHPWHSGNSNECSAATTVPTLVNDVSGRRRTPQLPLEGRDVLLTEAPLATGLEGGQDLLARVLVDGV